MRRYAKYREWLYAVTGVFSLYKVVTLWRVDQSRAYLFLFFLVLSIGMFFFSRHFRKKFENRDNS